MTRPPLEGIVAWCHGASGTVVLVEDVDDVDPEAGVVVVDDPVLGVVPGSVPVEEPVVGPGVAVD